MAGKKLINLTVEDFDQHTFESSTPALVMFGSTVCSVCKAQLPIVEQAALHYDGLLNSYWVDVAQYKSLFQRFRLKGIPQLVLFQQGELVEKIGGLIPKEILIEVLAQKLTAVNP